MLKHITIEALGTGTAATVIGLLISLINNDVGTLFVVFALMFYTIALVLTLVRVAIWLGRSAWSLTGLRVRIERVRS